MNIKKPTYRFIVVLFFLARLVFFIASPYDIIPGYGDYWNFFNQAKLGTPFLHFWTEFPPLFPFMSRTIFLLVNGKETAYSYVLALVISLFQALDFDKVVFWISGVFVKYSLISCICIIKS